MSFNLACLIFAELLLVLIEHVPFGDLLGYFWTKSHLLQILGYQTANKSDVTTANEICLANCRWNELPVFKICELNKKRNKETNSSQNVITIYAFEA